MLETSIEAHLKIMEPRSLAQAAAAAVAAAMAQIQVRKRSPKKAPYLAQIVCRASLKTQPDRLVGSKQTSLQPLFDWHPERPAAAVELYRYTNGGASRYLRNMCSAHSLE